MSVSEAPTEQTAHQPTEHLQGIVERVTYHAEDSGYTVARLKVPSHTDLVTIVGRFPCTGYLDHPFENKPVKTGKDLLRLLANRVGWMYNPKLSPAYSCSTTLFSQDGETSCMARIFTTLQQLKDGCLHALSSRLTRWTKPLGTSLPLQTLTDLSRSKSELIAENALLRQQLIILKRQVKRPTCMKNDRLLLVLLARMVRTWQQSLLIVQPDTLLRWHREFFRLYWKRKSKASTHQPKVAAETIALPQADGEGQSTLGR